MNPCFALRPGASPLRRILGTVACLCGAAAAVLATSALASGGSNLAAAAAPASAGEAARRSPRAGVIPITRVLAAGPIGHPARVAFHRDPIEAAIVAGSWTPPRSGGAVVPSGAAAAAAGGPSNDGAGGPRDAVEAPHWKELEAGDDGWFRDEALQGSGYADARIDTDADRVWLLDASGHSMVYVDGVPRAGDPYRMGKHKLPVRLTAGTHHLLFRVTRGAFRARLIEPPKALFLDTADATLPDLPAGEPIDLHAAILVTAATETLPPSLLLRARLPGEPPTETPIRGLTPLSLRKVAFMLHAGPPAMEGEASARLELVRRRDGGEDTVLDAITVKLSVRDPAGLHVCTFRSRADGSVQSYAVLPARPEGGSGKGGGSARAGERSTSRAPAEQRSVSRPAPPRPALFLTLHGAGVEARNQAASYAPKSWGDVVAPTNRRPFGFDWEDWGRRDALEVLERAQTSLNTDPLRTYLTGHSMGGHGTWQVGVTFPDRFAALGPSAGWIRFASYASVDSYDDKDPIESILARAASSSDTLAMVPNTLLHGIYVLHGDEDDNVPVTEARAMRETLAAFHHDVMAHEEPGAGHWWDRSDEPGVDCVDWAPMFDFFARHEIPPPGAVRELEFTTMNPAVSATCRWVWIDEQVHAQRPSMVRVRRDPGRRRITGSTQNIARIGIDVASLGPGPVTFALDGGPAVEVPATPNAVPAGETVPGVVEAGPAEQFAWVWLEHVGALDSSGPDAGWRLAARPPLASKGAHRGGPFKQVFDHGVILVHGTRGTPEENAWALAKARFDAETFLYRGNGSLAVIPDTAFDAFPTTDRNVVLYGNADTNALWPRLLGESPVQVRRGAVTVGPRSLAGDDLACLFLRPRPGSDIALVGAVSGSGLAGMRLTDRLPVFVSGIAYPDVIVAGADVLASGTTRIRAAGFFGNDWGLDTGEIAWRNPQGPVHEALFASWQDGGEARALPGEPPPPVTFELRLDPSRQPKPYAGRLYVMLTRREGVEPRRILSPMRPEPFFARDVRDLAPGEPASIDSGALAFPVPLDDLDAGTWFAQAVARRNPDSPEPGRGAGDLVSEVARIEIGPPPGKASSDGTSPPRPRSPQVVSLLLDRAVEEEPFVETDRERLVTIQSKRLSDFFGRPIRMRAAVRLPAGWSESGGERYPVVWWIPGFGGDHHSLRRLPGLFQMMGSGETLDRVLLVVPDPNHFRGHTVFADSANNGPWGQALLEELIPAVEKRFRGAGAAQRYVTGVSSGGWSSLWLQVTYPEAFAGCWSMVPDPVDFRDFQRLDLYEPGVNFYHSPGGTPRPVMRIGTRAVMDNEPFVRFEEVHGPGGQMHAFEAVFSPRGADGDPRPLFDRATGAVDHAVALTWERYDIRKILEDHWNDLGPRLAGKLHVYAGEIDTFYLEGAVRLLRESLTRLGSDAVVEIVPGAVHQPIPAAFASMSETIQRRVERLGIGGGAGADEGAGGGAGAEENEGGGAGEACAMSGSHPGDAQPVSLDPRQPAAEVEGR